MTDQPKTGRSRRRAPAPTTPDPIEIAMEAEANGEGGEDSPARRVLLKHEQLLGWQILKERAGFGLRVLTGVVGVVAALLVGSLIWEASQERGLVIEPFSVPPEFAERGVTGQVIASRLLDRLSEMSDQTVSVRAPSTYANNWNGDIKVQIPQTGVSVGELRRYLVEWLGKQTTIGGELYRTPTGLALTARTGTATATPQTGAGEGDLDAMIQAAAEQVYAATQPYRYAIYLNRRGDAEGAAKSEAALRALIKSGDKADRMWAHSALNLVLQNRGDWYGAVREADAALAVEPKFALAYSNRWGALSGMDHAEDAYQSAVLAARLARSDGHRFLREEGLAYMRDSSAAIAAEEIGDARTAIEGYRRALESRPDDEQMIGSIFSMQVASHDLDGARATLDRLSSPPADAPPEILEAAGAINAALQAQLAWEAEDWRGVVRHLGAVDPDNRAFGDTRWRVVIYPYLAMAMARTGDTERAARVIAATRTDCYQCVIARAVIAEEAGDRARADRWFAEAVRQSPSLPFAHAEWGRVKLARGDLDGAEADFREASRRSPNWADPLKGWGDVLMAKNDARGAARRYEAALERAPQWTAARQALTRARG
ncbi:hypothetical protein [Brevundimonas sp. NIBR11]|uniref:tetratricopeptide repeat protein n=1 Tax=Brevundimonas sp. NIBR11 TaxID=3015999 RepID=UPI0022F08C39|nr:hypothetical protein [Brevundimonas sp. NIBR11]WGM30051.1 hypothetical protein KKHFBJBL_00266 [Brevundimonas sp. NIBR11]